MRGIQNRRNGSQVDRKLRALVWYSLPLPVSNVVGTDNVNRQYSLRVIMDSPHLDLYFKTQCYRAIFCDFLSKIEEINRQPALIGFDE